MKEDSSWQGLATLAFSTLRLLFPGENSVSWSKSDVRGFRIFLEGFFFFFQEKNKHVRTKSLGELRSHKERKGRKKEAIDGADSSSLGPASCCLETPKTQPFVKPIILSGFFGIKWCSSDTADALGTISEATWVTPHAKHCADLLQGRWLLGYWVWNKWVSNPKHRTDFKMQFYHLQKLHVLYLFCPYNGICKRLTESVWFFYSHITWCKCVLMTRMIQLLKTKNLK